MRSDNSIKIDVESVRGLLKDVQDNDHNGVLSAGDVLDDGVIRISFTKEGDLALISGYELSDSDVESYQKLTQVVRDLSGRMVHVLQGGGLFRKNAYFAVSYADSVQI